MAGYGNLVTMLRQQFKDRYNQLWLEAHPPQGCPEFKMAGNCSFAAQLADAGGEEFRQLPRKYVKAVKSPAAMIPTEERR